MDKIAAAKGVRATRELKEEIKKHVLRGVPLTHVARHLGMDYGKAQAIWRLIKIDMRGEDYSRYGMFKYKEKCAMNAQFFDLLNPKSILDVYAGQSFWKQHIEESGHDCEVTTNDIDPEMEADHQLDALEFLCLMYPREFDIVDLDPFGSAAKCTELAVQMATKGFIQTYGEMEFRRFREMDLVSRWYGIEEWEDWTLDNLGEATKKIARRNLIDLEVLFVRQYHHMGRIWYTVGDIKIDRKRLPAYTKGLPLFEAIEAMEAEEG